MSDLHGSTPDDDILISQSRHRKRYRSETATSNEDSSGRQSISKRSRPSGPTECRPPPPVQHLQGASMDQTLQTSVASLELGSSSETDSAEIVYLDDEDENPKTSGEILKDEVPTHVKERRGLRDIQCPVCLCEPDIVAITTCGHMYCSDCVFRALSSSSRATVSRGECSICRRRVPYNQVTFLEFRLGSQTPEICLNSIALSADVS